MHESQCVVVREICLRRHSARDWELAAQSKRRYLALHYDVKTTVRLS
jgi:hypothetical protein